MAAPRILILADEPIGTIRPALHGHFAEHLGTCINDGLWVGENSTVPNIAGIRSDVLEALRRIRVPVLRWPGGCYAEDYHWEDGIGPVKDRPRRVNRWWGHEIECNTFGTHEFMKLCGFLGAEPYLAGNVGTGSPGEMRNWMEYCNFAGDSTLARRRGANGSPQPFNVRLWGVGNEAWGCGGNMCPEDYAREYKRFAATLSGFGTDPYLIACGPDGNKPDWTRRFLTKFLSTPDHFHRRIDAIAAHYYCGTAGPSATQFNTNQWYELLHKATLMETLIVDQRKVMDEFDPQRKISLVIDEWGTWHHPTPDTTPLWQQSTLRDALVAAITLDIFHRQCNVLSMTNIAQLVNVLQSLILTEPGGGRMALTPTFHVFDLYQPHREGRSLRTEFEISPIAFPVDGQRRNLPALMGSASVKDDMLTLSVVNPHATLPVESGIVVERARLRRIESIRVLRADDLTAHNTFDEPLNVAPIDTNVPDDAPRDWMHLFPPASVTVIRAAID